MPFAVFRHLIVMQIHFQVIVVVKKVT